MLLLELVLRGVTVHPGVLGSMYDTCNFVVLVCYIFKLALNKFLLLHDFVQIVLFYQNEHFENGLVGLANPYYYEQQANESEDEDASL